MLHSPESHSRGATRPAAMGRPHLDIWQSADGMESYVEKIGSWRASLEVSNGGSAFDKVGSWNPWGAPSSFDKACSWNPWDLHANPDERQVPCTDRMRFTLLSMRLRKAYVVYCFFCCLLSFVVCLSTTARVLKLRSEGRHFSSHQWRTWEANVDVLIGIVVCAETICTLWLAGWDAFIHDCWCIFDAIVMSLTLLNWSLLVLRKVLLPGDEMLQVDLFLLALRFVLQPCRVLAALSMVRRVSVMQKSTVDIGFDVLGTNVIETAPSTPTSHQASDGAIPEKDIEDLDFVI